MLIRVEAFAKVNLSLEVGPPRPDGYHEIETVMQAVSVADTITLEEAEALSVVADDPSVPQGEGNIVWAAAKLLAREAAVPAACAIQIAKKIPAVAGLGGGSSDAAAVLAGLSALWSLGASAEDLKKLGGRLGSDVPFFFHGGAAICRGRGEEVEPIVSLAASERLLLVTPPVEISSSLVYKELDRLRLTRGSSFSNMGIGSVPGVGTAARGISLFNRLEDAVLPTYPIVKAMIDRVSSAAHSNAIMSGSGPSVFAFLDREENDGTLLSRFDDGRFAAVVHPVSCGFRIRTCSGA